MFKILIFTSILATTMAGIIENHHHHYEHHEEPKEEAHHETDHHHEIDHKHATSHQSFKIHHFHAVPTYIKKEDQEFLKHPVEIAGVKHKLKIVHPETEHHHGHGLTLENHQEVEDKTLGHHHSYNYESRADHNVEEAAEPAPAYEEHESHYQHHGHYYGDQ